VKYETCRTLIEREKALSKQQRISLQMTGIEREEDNWKIH